MSATFSVKTPPPFNAKTDDYCKWKKKFEIWESITEVAETKRGGLLVLRLDDDTQDDILEQVTSDQLKAEDGAKTVITKLDKMFKKNESMRAYEIYDRIQKYIMGN